MEQYVSRDEAEQAMGRASLSSRNFPALGQEVTPQVQIPEERSYSRGRQRRGTRPLEMQTAEPVVERTLKEKPSQDKEFMKKVKKINSIIIGVTKQIYFINTINSQSKNKDLIYQFNRIIKNLVDMRESTKTFEMIRTGSQNIYFSENFFNKFQSFYQTKNTNYLGLVQLNSIEKINRRFKKSKEDFINYFLNEIDQIVRFDLIYHIINLYLLFREKYSEDSVEKLIFRIQKSINLSIEKSLSRSFVSFDTDRLIEFYIGQILIGHDLRELNFNLQKSSQQRENIDRVIRLTEQQRSERIRDDLIKKRQIEMQKDLRQRFQAPNSLYQDIVGELETNVKKQISEGREAQPGSLTNQLRYMIDKRFRNDDEYQIKVPSRFQDPASLDLMRNPVILSDGKSYDITTVQGMFGPTRGSDGQYLELTTQSQTYLDLTVNPSNQINIVGTPAGPRPKFLKNEVLRQEINDYLENVYPTFNNAQIAAHDFDF